MLPPKKKLCLNANTVRTVSEHRVLKTPAAPGAGGTTNAAALYHAKSNCVEPIMQNLLEKSSFEIVKNERMHPFPSCLSDLF